MSDVQVEILMECKALTIVLDGCIQDKCCLNLLGEVMNAAGIVLPVRRLGICRVALIPLLCQSTVGWNWSVLDDLFIRLNHMELPMFDHLA